MIPVHKPGLAIVLISDSNYLARCSVAIETGNFGNVAHILGIDFDGKSVGTLLPGTSVTNFLDFLDENTDVAKRINSRSRVEQIFSVGPSFMLHFVDKVAPNGWIVYVDSDLFFLQPIAEYLNSLPPCDVVIAPHRHYLWNRSRLAQYGQYNVGLVAFKNNKEGLRALRFWAESCIDWCYDRAEDGKYADQKYLEQFASVSEGVFVDNSLGANLAPWNSFLKRISKTKTGEIFVRRDKLLYFHAQGLKQKNGRWVLGHLNYLSFAGPRLKKLVYGPYLAKLEEWSQKPGFEGFGTSRTPTTLLGRLAASLIYSLSLLTGQTIKIGTTRSGAQE